MKKAVEISDANIYQGCGTLKEKQYRKQLSNSRIPRNENLPI